MSVSPKESIEQIIRKEFDERTGVLDFYGFELIVFPDVIREMTWLKILSFSDQEPWDKEKQSWSKGVHKPQSGQISILPEWFGVLEQITHLNLDGTYIENLDPISSLTKLKILFCDSQRLSNLKPLSKLIEIEELTFNDSQVSDLCPLEGLSNLKSLYCDSTKVSDLRPLEGSKLKTLSFCSTKVSDLRPLEGLSNLKRLGCAYTEVSDLLPLESLSNLRSLNCSDTKVSNLQPLESLSNLRSLNCIDTKVSDLRPLEGLSNLKTLGCAYTKVSNLRPLKGLSNLKSLNCSDTKVSDLRPLESLSNLKSLNCSDTKVSDLRPLEGLSNLQSLNCNDTKVSDLSPLEGLSNLNTLDCSFTGVSDLRPLEGLSNLKSLNCNDTKVSDLRPLEGLSNLNTLDCGSTGVSDLRPLEGLSNLMTLDFDSTKVSNLRPLEGLSNLKSLNCNDTKVNDLRPLEGLSNLKSLSCSDTKVSDLRPLEGLSNLQSLNCNDTKVSDLRPLEGLSNLKSLSCSDTKVSDLRALESLSNLKSLNCNDTKVSDLRPLEGLSNLESLSCSDTKVNDLRPLEGLTNLMILNCAETKVSDLTPILTILKKGFCSYRNNPLISPPIEFAEQSKDAILDYFDQLGSNPVALNELKIIFLGEGASGKTSLIKRLRDEEFNLKEEQTHGIRIRKTNFDINGDAVKAHLWDFGGQEVMHATHQFFLSERCIYVLVLNSRSDDRAEHWLKHAKFFGGESPVLVVLNKIDENPSFDIERKVLNKKYSQIKGYYPLSCKNNQGIEFFQEALIKLMSESITRRTPFPATWSAVKDRFEDSKKDYTDSAYFTDICIEEGVKNTFSQKVLLKFLHDLGVIIHFEELLQYCDMQILNPIWLTTGVYRIINSEFVAENKGVLYQNQFDKVINDPRYKLDNTNEKEFLYPVNYLIHIVRIMQQFELCYPLDSERYVIPQLLPVAEPDFNFEGASIHFEAQFPIFFPDSIFPRLMVKLHSFIENDLHWRSGMVLQNSLVFDAKARIRADKEDRKISIDVCGEEPRRLLSFIRATIKEITADFKDLKYQEKVTIPHNISDQVILMDYSDIVAYEVANELEIFIPDLRQRVSIKDILDGVEDAEMRDEATKTELQAFVSYSHKDREGVNKLRAALAPARRLGNLTLWDDRAIDAGEDWEDEIFEQLENSDIVLCVISQDFLNSDFCDLELNKALKRHSKKTQTVVPIRYRSCDWDDLPIAKLQSPLSGWIKSSDHEDVAWTEVSKGIKPIIDKIKKRKLENKKNANLIDKIDF
ncbi:leucine-rich repeat domain-containing protein [Cocleimonas sp. KMM 6892]|uniref:leucine-rich repeat domain-containing protein n=1 Tax=unclassified Cocleimonas TaxID=2639732 RepID=UPI002DBD44E0|nr:MULTISPECIES: leucine-rich repeat domain-containing protein [unclassified Cocleimonas]MEB8434316.1 leucine-rich repeat domain-containing protein [Cocleimonas sp. KMM 6892]MEC4717281.1 leucine-rich repeat domain-containing protein [Cocleimonas sp. KMM 6895]MEC4746660.1 leucine-rich repeat domain-containing protein [Cocleimonas sp. KMM 6896]